MNDYFINRKKYQASIIFEQTKCGRWTFCHSYYSEFLFVSKPFSFAAHRLKVAT